MLKRTLDVCSCTFEHGTGQDCEGCGKSQNARVLARLDNLRRLEERMAKLRGQGLLATEPAAPSPAPAPTHALAPAPGPAPAPAVAGPATFVVAAAVPPADVVCACRQPGSCLAPIVQE